MTPRVPSLHVVTDDEILSRDDFAVRAEELLAAGGAELALHVRGPATDGATLHRLAAALLPAAEATRATLLVNDRVDVALTVGAHGAHLGGRSIPVASARDMLGPGRLLGRSTHELGEAVAAAEEGADYLFVGTIHPTPSHPGVPGRGGDAVEEAVAGVEVPVIAIGGIRPEHVAELKARGAHGVAVIRGAWAHPRPADAVVDYLEALRKEER